jgi:hypothetical protein
VVLEQTLLTAWCASVVLGSLLVIGACFVWLLSGRRPLGEAEWLLAPFAGLAVVTVVAQNLVYQDVPLPRATVLLWAAAVAVAAWMWRRGALAAALRTLPRRVFAVAVAAYLVQGAALFAVGARHYAGRAWEDQYTYTVVTQFLMDEPFRVSREEIGQRPYLYRVLARAMGPLDFPSHKEHRIGQSVLHGFFAATARLPAKTLFMPTILLSSSLLVVAVYALGTGLGLDSGRALLAGACAGVLPGLAALNLECFLSHALAVPLIVFWIEALRRLAATLRIADLVTACLLLTAMVAIYTDFGVPMLAETVLCLGLAAVGHRQPVRLVACLAALVVAPFVLNPRYAEMTLFIWNWVSTPNVLAGLYPWAFGVEGIARLWLGDWAASPASVVRVAAQAAGVLLTALGYAGLVRAAWPAPGKPRPSLREVVATRAFALGALAFALLPVVLLLKDRDHPYQFYKMLLTVSPLLALGLAFVGRGRPIGRAVQVAVLVLAVWQTGRLALETARAEPAPRSAAHVLLDPDMRELEDTLEALAGRDLVIVHSRGPMVTGWLSYFARRNRVWLADPEVFSDDIRKTPSARPILDLGRAPVDALLLTDRHPRHAARPSPGARVLWENRSFQLWTPVPGPWAVVLRTDNRNGLETVDGKPFFWIGHGDTRLVVLAGQAGRLALGAEFHPGVFGPDQRVDVYGASGRAATLVSRDGRQSVQVPVTHGITEVRLVPQGRFLSRHPTDPRLMVVGVRDLAASFEPSS